MALLEQYHIPVWVMEPLRGGRLARLPEKAEGRLKDLRPQESIPAWAFRFLQTFPNVKMILSGMSDFVQLKENIKTFETEEPLTEKEMTTLLSVAEECLQGNAALYGVSLLYQPLSAGIGYSGADCSLQ